jgi:hypothetical protein
LYSSHTCPIPKGENLTREGDFGQFIKTQEHTLRSQSKRKQSKNINSRKKERDLKIQAT